MAEFTFLKLDLEDATFNAPFAAGDTDEESPEQGTTEAEDEASSGRGKAVVGALVGLAFLVGVALLAKRKLGGGGDDETDEDVEVEVVTT